MEQTFASIHTSADHDQRFVITGDPEIELRFTPNLKLVAH